MTIEGVQRFCMGLPHATQAVQWEDNLVLKVGGKMFAVVALEPSRVWLPFKCSAKDFADLTERPGIVPAPYLARASWVGLEEKAALGDLELQQYLQRAYETVVAKLPVKIRKSMLGGVQAGDKNGGSALRRRHGHCLTFPNSHLIRIHPCPAR